MTRRPRRSSPSSPTTAERRRRCAPAPPRSSPRCAASPMPRLRLIAVLLTAALTLSGCDIWNQYFGDPKVPLPGERIPVLKLDRQLAADPQLAETKVLLPKPYENRDWAQAGGNSSHAMHHLALAEAPKLAWQVGIGSSAGSSEQLLGDPVVADG